jgi:ubiquinone/menaquinone biosynthesis C-methylase UbiE
MLWKLADDEQYQTAKAQQEFDSWSRRYDWDPLQWLFFRPSHRMMLRYIRADDQRLLDIGCGTGNFALRAMEAFPKLQVVGLDLSAGMLKQAAPRCRQTRDRFIVVQADSERLPLADNLFDVVTCCHSFHHYPRQARVVAEMHRVLRPGGRLLIVDGDRDRLWGHFVFDGLVVWAEGAVKHLSGPAFRDIYQEHGFGAIRQERRGGPLPVLLTIGRAIKPSLAEVMSEAA